MQEAVILAAGRGTRLNGAAGGGPKCLTRVGGKPLIEHQVDMLRAAGIATIWVVVGHRADRVAAHLNGVCRYIYNPEYATTNSLHSLWLARTHVRGGFMLLNSDVLVHPDAVIRLREVQSSALLYDATSGEDAEHMKVHIEGGMLRQMSKTLPAQFVCGENVGVLQFDCGAARGLFCEADALVRSGSSESWAPAAVSRLAQAEPIRCVDIDGLPWVEIDFAEDLERARHEVWPAISDGAPS